MELKCIQTFSLSFMIFAELLGFSPRSQECMARIFSFCYVDQMKKFQLQISISDEIFFLNLLTWIKTQKKEKFANIMLKPPTKTQFQSLQQTDIIIKYPIQKINWYTEPIVTNLKSSV